MTESADSPRSNRRHVHLAIATAVLLVAGLVALGQVDDGAGERTAAVATDADAPMPGARNQPESAGAAEGGAPRAGGQDAAVASAAGEGGATSGTGTAAAPAAGRFPGVGTPEALANPNCDPETGQVRVPTKWAPECVVAWPAGSDNGGATSLGVSSDTIRLVVYDTSGDEDRAQNRQVITNFLEIFNHHYELWGRDLEVVFYPQSGSDEVAQRADAVEVAGLKPFMVTNYMTFGSASPDVFSAELAARGIIVWDPSTYYDQTHSQAGFRWGSHDNHVSALYAAEFIGKRLVGHAAKWAGAQTMRPQKRVFGLVYDEGWDVEAFSSTFAALGGEVVEAIGYDPSDDATALQNQARTMVARMADAGVTSVINVTNVVFNAILTRESTAQRYNPEWVLTGWGATDTTVAGHLADPQQWANAFGVGFTPIQSSDTSNYDYSKLYRWEYGTDSPDLTLTGQIWQFAKHAMSGLQLAGPNLTPTTFRNALFTMNPKGGAHCGCVESIGGAFGRNLAGYTGDKYAANSDVSEKWFDVNTVGTNEIGITAAGAIRFVNDGRRYLLGQIPTGEPDMFNPENGRTAYDELPPNDRDPEYPHEH